MTWPAAGVGGISWLALPLGFFLDVALGDPPRPSHPVRLVAQLALALEGLLRFRVQGRPAGELAAGGLATALTVTLAWLAGLLLVGLAARVSWWLGLAVESWLVATTVATRELARSGRTLARLLAAGDLTGARKELSQVVARDTADLSSQEVARGAVETVAENTVDGVIAPLFYAALGGAPLALAYRAVNTLDSLWGYRNERYLYFGRVAARLDDAANWLPARLGAFFLVLAACLLPGLNGRAAWRVLRRDGANHPSPNSGRPEAAVAGALGVRLGGSNLYAGVLSHRPYLGQARNQLDHKVVRRAVGLLWLAALLGVAAATALAGLSKGGGLP